MAAAGEYNIVFKVNDIYYDFCKFVLEQNDGSSYIILKRKDKSTFHTTASVDDSGAIIKQQEMTDDEKPRSKRKKISYHTTGLVKFHDLDIRPFCHQPLYNITHENHFLYYSVPSISGLDEINIFNEKDTKVIDWSLMPTDKRFTFFFVVSNTKSKFTDIPLFTIEVSPMYVIFCFVGEFENDFIKQNPRHFIYFSPASNSIGKHVGKDEEEQALSKYYQKKFGVEEAIFSINKKTGIIRVIFVVPMRIKPVIICEFINDDYKLVECEGCSNKEVRFKIKYKSQNYVALNCIKSLVFSAEL